VCSSDLFPSHDRVEKALESNDVAELDVVGCT